MAEQNFQAAKLYRELQKKAGNFNGMLYQAKDILASKGFNTKWLDKMVEDCNATVFDEDLAILLREMESGSRSGQKKKIKAIEAIERKEEQ